jgi:hypothetical protein
MTGTHGAQGREAEVDTIHAFIVAARRDRWIADLGRPMLKRSKTVRLHDTRDFDTRYLQAIPKAAHTAEGVAALLRQRGAPDGVWLMSPEYGEPKLLDDALAELMVPGADGLVICIPGRLAYLQTEVDGGYLLAR